MSSQGVDAECQITCFARQSSYFKWNFKTLQSTTSSVNGSIVAMTISTTLDFSYFLAVLTKSSALPTMTQVYLNHSSNYTRYILSLTGKINQKFMVNCLFMLYIQWYLMLVRCVFPLVQYQTYTGFRYMIRHWPSETRIRSNSSNQCPS